MTNRAVDAVVFDLGGVMLRSGSVDDTVARYPNTAPEVITQIVAGDYGAHDSDHPWHRAERGEIPYDEARAAIRAGLTAAGIEPAPRPGGRGSQPSTNSAMVELVRDLRGAGLATALLTNNIREFRPYWWAVLPFEELFDVIVDSHEVGMRKPSADIYALTLERLGGIAPERTLFLDDHPANVSGALAVGWHSVRVVGDGADAIVQARRLAGL